MENKFKKKSINTVIYLLLAAMLVCMVLVSVYTVASKRKGKDADTEPAVSSGTVDTKNEPAGNVTTGKSETTAADTTAPAESARLRSAERRLRTMRSQCRRRSTISLCP